ncbi:hypothetical protein ZEAMMB73_Zm00001d013322 [Zea mays]|jgi:hypothetical protein|uniref:Uncharacterized protein n=1 Tax=Zea mays TaxID=4577 RepID=A0A1D6GI52_MAIZE|nr:hypothetical protein ZEAMMB73_Zm00001d013322 [Zea mays]
MLSPDTEKKRKGMWIQIDGVHEVNRLLHLGERRARRRA